MKLSWAWIFDHIAASRYDYNIEDVVKSFNTTTAEIESIESIAINLAHYYIVQVSEIKSEITVYCAELQKQLIMPNRQDAKIGSLFVIKQENSKYAWAHLAQWGSDKEGLIPAVWVKDSELAGTWKEHFEHEDYILHIENKSITHRPDLWGHRGIAREIASLVKKPLIDEKKLYESIDVKHDQSFGAATPNSSCSFALKNTALCKALSGCVIPSISVADSTLFFVSRLSKIGARPLNSIIDATNYVMFDLGQPMHAYDAQKIDKKLIEVRSARYGEKLTLLDGQDIVLTQEDLVIADSEKPLSLAGVMGGKNSSITSATTSIILESGCFDAVAVRKSALRHKKRTESSTRFEKSLDPHLTTPALQRFLKLLHKQNILNEMPAEIIQLGQMPQPIMLVISHQLIEQRLGSKLESSIIESILKRLGFNVTRTKDDYFIEVPSWRASKDITRPEDIIEEIGRFIGYSTISRILPSRLIQPFDTREVENVWLLKNNAAAIFSAHEVQNYPFYDEEFLNIVQWRSKDGVAIQNPVSQHWTTLVTSLVPHLLKNIYQNADHSQDLRFFELNRTWNAGQKNTVSEHKVFAAIFYQPKHEIDFYQIKSLITRLFDAFNVQVQWRTHKSLEYPWMHPSKTASLIINNKPIGYATLCNPTFFKSIAEGNAFIVELNTELLFSGAERTTSFKPLAKYPASWFDISMFIPLQLTVDTIIETIAKEDARIERVMLVDFFEKKEWADKRSITIRLFVRDPEKTLTSADIEYIHNHALIIVQQLGAQVR